MSEKKQVLQYDENGAFIRKYDSIQEAQNYLGITHISSVCRGKRRMDGGYIWKYADNSK